MRLPSPPPRPRAENTIALINVVFLLLMFFIVAGTLASQAERTVTLAESEQAADSAPDTRKIVLLADGALLREGQPTTVEEIAGASADRDVPLRIAADRDAPASRLVELVADFRAAGFSDVAVLVSRARAGAGR